MEAEDVFVSVASLICEPTRARMLWSLLDGRAYTAGELSVAAGVSPTAASNHLSRLLGAGLLKVEKQGRSRYYSFARPEVAYTVESLAGLAGDDGMIKAQKTVPVSGVRYCRTCYDHLAGFVGVKVAEAMEARGYLEKNGTSYIVAEAGWVWLSGLDIFRSGLTSRRPLTRQCLDWSERRPHLAGQLGAVLLEKMQERRWFKTIQFSRELTITAEGRRKLFDWLGIVLP